MSLKDALTGKTAQEIEAIAGYVLDGIDALASVTNNPEIKEADAVLSGVKAVVDGIIADITGDKISAADVEAKIPPLEQTIADDNAAADAAAAEKFKGKP